MLHVNGAHRKEFEKQVAPHLEKHGLLQNYECVMKRKNGETFTAEHYLAPLLDAGGRRTGWINIIRDITKRKINEQRRLNYEKIESLGLLAGGIAHDLNNIMTSVVGYIDLVRQALDGRSEEKEMLTNALQACSAAHKLTYRLMTFAKGGAPVKKLQNAASIIEETAGFALSGSNVKCRLETSDDLYPVEIDTGQINQALINIVMNAAQAMPDGGIMDIKAVNVALKDNSLPQLDPGKYIKISVRDYGMGIPAAHIPKIFDPFFTTKGNGRGLGLSIASSIIRKHNGNITLESNEGKGTAFHVYLPAAQTPLVKQREAGRSEELICGSGMIILMDDDLQVLEVTDRMLSRLGYRVITAKDGGEALALYKKLVSEGERISAVILDLTVKGGMGGKECIKHLLELTPDVKALISSGYSEDPVMSDYKSHGFREVIKKPFSIVELSEALSRVIKS